jgi:hypothetical protein
MAAVIHVTFQQQLMHVNGSTKDRNMEWKSWSCWTAAHHHLHTTAPAAPARDSGPHPHFTTRQALLGQKSSMGCSIPQAGSKDKKREKGRACFKKIKNKKETTSICKGESSVDSKGMDDFSTPNSQRTSMCGKSSP